MTKTYAIKDGYRHKSSSEIMQNQKKEEYWTPGKIPLSKYYQYAVYAYAARLIGERSLTSVVDVGCGPAYKLMELVYPICQDVVGIDQKHAVEFCKNNYGRGVFLADDLNNPITALNRTFDLVICSDVIEHVLDPDVLLQFIKRFCHDKTLILFSTPERDVLRGVANIESPNPEHVREWNKVEFVSYLESSGLKVEEAFLTRHMRFNLSSLYLKELLDFSFNPKHCLTVLATVNSHT